MPKKIQFEWELPDALVDALTPETTEVAETIKTAAVLDWVRTHKLSLRRGAVQTPLSAVQRLCGPASGEIVPEAAHASCG